MKHARGTQRPSSAEPPAPRRGVEEVVLRTKDWRGFELTDSSGQCVMYVEMPEAHAVQSRIDWLWGCLDGIDKAGPKLALL